MIGGETGFNEFDITRPSPGENSTIVLLFAAKRGQAIMRVEGDSGVLASGRFNGFLTRDVVEGGPVVTDHIFPGRPALPFTVGEEASLNYADEFEAEGATFLQLDGSGALSNATPVGSKLTPHTGGKWGVTQTGETALFQVTAILDPVNADNDFRIRAERIHQ